MFNWLKRKLKPPAKERVSGEEAAAEYWLRKYREAKINEPLIQPENPGRKGDFIIFPEDKPKGTPWEDFAASYRETVLGKKDEKKDEIVAAKEET